MKSSLLLRTGLAVAVALAPSGSEAQQRQPASLASYQEPSPEACDNSGDLIETYRALYGVAVRGAHAGELLNPADVREYVRGAAAATALSAQVGADPILKIGLYQAAESLADQRKTGDGAGDFGSAARQAARLRTEAVLDAVYGLKPFEGTSDQMGDYGTFLAKDTEGTPGFPLAIEPMVDANTTVIELSVLARNCGQQVDDPR